MSNSKGKAWRRKAMAAGMRKEKTPANKPDPRASNHERMKMKAAARVYREKGDV